ncbi:MAG TPA: energy transducer TonB [Opitutaceae bacterium]|nr:energy transducer TonB [Opitutaceae bacterium]
MKQILATAVAALVLTGSALAYSPGQSAAFTHAAVIKLVPITVVQPENLPRTFTRALLTVEFALDRAGQPQDVQVVSKTDRVVRDQVVKAFKQWRFDPQAGSTAKRFTLPVEVVVPGV